MGAALLEMADHARQFLIQQRFAQPVQHHAFDRGKLIDDAAEVLVARSRSTSRDSHVRGHCRHSWLQRVVGSM